MKKLIGILLICLLLPALSISAEINTDRRVEWEQDQPTSVILTHWELFWSDTSGGPYVKITDIAKPASPPVPPSQDDTPSPATSSTTAQGA